MKFQSTHPVRGATRKRAEDCGNQYYFNPRTPCGVRRINGVSVENGISISIHAPRAGCDRFDCLDMKLYSVFQSTHPVRGATCGYPAWTCESCDFNPRTPCGVRRHIVANIIRCIQFQSTHPVRGATCVPQVRQVRVRNFNPRTPCGVRRRLLLISISCKNFNPRTPCGVRRRLLLISISCKNFNPRTPCGVRLKNSMILIPHQIFQSTHPVRGATILCYRYKGKYKDFNPRTPCGVRRFTAACNACAVHISIHAPRAGCDYLAARHCQRHLISIHAPRAGCDGWSITKQAMEFDFNPRTPCGVRPRISRKCSQLR